MLLILLKEREAVSSPIANTVHIFKQNKGVQLAQKKISRVKCIIFKCKVFLFFFVLLPDTLESRANTCKPRRSCKETDRQAHKHKIEKRMDIRKS